MPNKVNSPTPSNGGLVNNWVDGWYQAARHVASPNFGPRPSNMPITLAVIHSISLPPSNYDGDHIERLFTNTLDWTAHPYFETIKGMEVSAHFLIRRHGELVQFVSVLDRAWHAGLSTWCGRDNCNDYSVGIELEGIEDGLFEATQYDALVDLLRSLNKQWPLLGVTGHEHIAPHRKRDPGAAFNWAWLEASLAWPHVIFPNSA